MARGFNTKLLHATSQKKDAHSAIQFPIYATSAYGFDTAEDIAGAFQNTRPAFAYSRSGNPTVDFFETRVKSITGANQVVAFSSGMAAITATVFTLCQAGDNVIISPKMFGNSVLLFTDTLKSLGLEVRLADFTQLDRVAAKIDARTRMLFFEVLNNPFLEIVDLEKLKSLAAEKQVMLCADTTLTPPNIFDAAQWGIHISIVSSTKYFSDGGVSVGGLVIDHGTFDWTAIPHLQALATQYGKNAFAFKLRKEILRNTGACLSPFNAFLQSIGLETMSLRFDRMNDNAFQLAQWLQKHPAVKKVSYPMLPDSPYYESCQRYLQGKAGGLLTFELESQSRCFAVMNRLKVIKRATNLSDNRSLIIHPLSTIYADFPTELLKEINLSERLIRLSVGIEEIEDLIDDLAQALQG
ncbi:MAG TPA: aminotransferase class I/II-fold pyridoxal phosphate-dependent enzyme [Bacteroidales bacterium]|nr:aminotransferase class I/II-fold pyridoxal phosphate-dependent enzyme [Bacteroidales bacterium]HPO66177.1 aminotransferase class I/II-fold pyridoxal phosphate-dependent enzyme [Bacteroidales bacterium]